jgi:CRISPR/Cas system-associated exonuclease Cas4 (RecB family)
LRDSAASKAVSRASRPSRSIHGSGHYHCGRQQLYSLLGYEPTDVNYVWEWDLSFRTGNALHGMIQDEFVDSGKAVIMPDGKPAIEIALGRDTLLPELAEEFAALKLGCRVDAVLVGNAGKHIPVEIKTVNNKYLNGSSQKYYPEKLADFEAQLQLYLYFYRNLETKEQSEFGLIYVVNSNDVTDRREYVVEFNPLFVQGELEHITMIRDYWLQSKLMDPEPHRGVCGFCQFKTACPAPDNQKK